MTVVAALMTAIAAVLCRPPDRWLVRQRLGLGSPRWRARRPVGSAVATCLIGAVAIGLTGPLLVLLLTGASVAAFGLRQWRAERRRRNLRERRAEVVAAIGLISAELRAGLLPQRVLAGLAGEFDFLAPAAHAARLGGDVPVALRTSAVEHGAELLDELAGAWLVAERAGAPLAHVLDRLQETAREDQEIEREVESGLAPARATGRLMAVLPVFGLALGSGMGGDPLAVLVGTWPGAFCLAAGCALACLGVAWVERIAADAERSA
ncbi:type II secretion system protein [Aeromicrobium sp. A1-2]|uniref:type II secretion system F family protein n=1 Tax=Aeromicrobium sp. A1-2 TaxID=2107713 RepID=UPI000E4E5D1D|nr:type II secretion system F family protein [Aeromicrobium sp. A1-2]AXT86203.1 type II secretion system protein [Aeromicrobium sp. A1-2]